MNSVLAPPPPPAEETDLSLLARLVAAIEAGQVHIHPDFGRLRLGDSPVAMAADGNIWFLPSAALVLLSWFGTSRYTDLQGWMVALPVLAAAIAVNLTLGRRYVNARIEKRLYAGIKDIAVWRKLWRYGGVALTAPGQQECRAPDGNWFEFARQLPPRT